MQNKNYNDLLSQSKTATTTKKPTVLVLREKDSLLRKTQEHGLPEHMLRHDFPPGEDLGFD
jgi:hypothetical protein